MTADENVNDGAEQLPGFPIKKAKQKDPESVALYTGLLESELGGCLAAAEPIWLGNKLAGVRAIVGRPMQIGDDFFDRASLVELSVPSS